MTPALTEMPTPIWINDSTSLAAAMQTCSEIVGIDTEFLRTDTFFPIAGLFQLSTREQVYLLDPLQNMDFEPFIRLLENEAVTKVMHACGEDLELFWHRLRVRPVNVFDTQLAYAYQEPRYSIGFVGLVEAVLGLKLSQSETRSDWLRRPLSSAQLHYAAEDVWYLLPLFDTLHTGLARLDRGAWYAEDILKHTYHQPEDPAEYYRHVNRAWLLADESLGRLQDLCTWRESSARQLDKPRRRLVLDEQLFELAQIQCLEEPDLSAVLSPGAQRRYGMELMRTHAQSNSRPTPIDAPLTPAEGKQLRRLREVAVVAAELSKIAPELIARKRDLEALYRHYRESGQLDAHYSGWRREIVGERLLSMLREF